MGWSWRMWVVVEQAWVDMQGAADGAEHRMVPRVEEEDIRAEVGRQVARLPRGDIIEEIVMTVINRVGD